jgi:hypothetical protein
MKNTNRPGGTKELASSIMNYQKGPVLRGLFFKTEKEPLRRAIWWYLAKGGSDSPQGWTPHKSSHSPLSDARKSLWGL